MPELVELVLVRDMPPVGQHAQLAGAARRRRCGERAQRGAAFLRRVRMPLEEPLGALRIRDGGRAGAHGVARILDAQAPAVEAIAHFDPGPQYVGGVIGEERSVQGVRADREIAAARIEEAAEVG